MHELAIVGGGPSAACVVQAVAEYLAPVAAVNVTVFEPGPNLWRGRVFQPDGDEVLANVSMEDMSARSWDSHHGVRWLRERGEHELAKTMAFPPRATVGRYLEETTEQAIAALRAAGSQLRVEKLSVRALTTFQGQLWVHGSESGSLGPFDNAVLCLGAPSAYDHYALAGAQNFVAEPYPLHKSLEDLPEHARVGIVGSGLTAVDVVMALQARGHQGPITLTSRNGLLPAVRQTPIRHVLRELTVQRIESTATRNGELRLADVRELVKAELAEAGCDASAIARDPTWAAPPVLRLQEELARALRDPDLGWSVVRDGMVACGQDAWYLLNESDKLQVRTFHQTLMRHCCPMPPGNAQRLAALFDTGQLTLLPGVHSVRPKPGGGFHIGASWDTAVDAVVAASTPSDHQVPIEALPLLASMRDQGLIVDHRFGGLRVERTTSRLVTREGVADSRLHALGDLTSGAYLFTFGMPALSTRAESIVHDIVTTVQKGSSRDYLPVRNRQGIADDRAAGVSRPCGGAGVPQAAADGGGAPFRVLRV